MTERLNFYSGSFSIDAENASQIAADLGNFDEDLSTIEYIADIHARREDIVKVINAVRIRYANSGADFLQTVSSQDDTTHLESVRTFQDTSEHENVGAVTEIKSFDMNYSLEIVGRMPAELKGKFVTYNDTGADAFKFGSSRSIVLTVNENGSAATTGAMVATFNSVSEDVPDKTHLTSGYNNMNLFSGAIARALSSQFPNSNGDQNLLKILVEQSSYENLMRIALGGCTTTTGSVVSIQSLMHSNTVAKGHGMNFQDLKDRVFDENLPSSRALGHEILLAIYDKSPPSLGGDDGAGRTVAYLNEDNTTDKRPWKVCSLEQADGDGLKFEYAANLINNETGNKINITLQFVLKTKLTMILRDGTQLQTLASPGDGATATSTAATMTIDWKSDTYDWGSEAPLIGSSLEDPQGSELGTARPTTDFFYVDPSDNKIKSGISPSGVGFRAFLASSGSTRTVVYAYRADETSATALANAPAGATHARKWMVMLGDLQDLFNAGTAVTSEFDLESYDDGFGGYGQPGNLSFPGGFYSHISLGLGSYNTYTYSGSRLSYLWLGHYMTRYDSVYGYLESSGSDFVMRMNRPFDFTGGRKYYVPILHNGSQTYDYASGLPTTILVPVYEASPQAVARNLTVSGSTVNAPGHIVKWALVDFGVKTKIAHGQTIAQSEVVGFAYSVFEDTVISNMTSFRLTEYGSDLNTWSGTTNYTSYSLSALGLGPVQDSDVRPFGQVDSLYSPYLKNLSSDTAVLRWETSVSETSAPASTSTVEEIQSTITTQSLAVPRHKISFYFSPEFPGLPLNFVPTTDYYYWDDSSGSERFVKGTAPHGVGFPAYLNILGDGTINLQRYIIYGYNSSAPESPTSSARWGFGAVTHERNWLFIDATGLSVSFIDMVNDTAAPGTGLVTGTTWRNSIGSMYSGDNGDGGTKHPTKGDMDVVYMTDVSTMPYITESSVLAKVPRYTYGGAWGFPGTLNWVESLMGYHYMQNKWSPGPDVSNALFGYYDASDNTLRLGVPDPVTKRYYPIFHDSNPNTGDLSTTEIQTDYYRYIFKVKDDSPYSATKDGVPGILTKWMFIDFSPSGSPYQLLTQSTVVLPAASGGLWMGDTIYGFQPDSFEHTEIVGPYLTGTEVMALSGNNGLGTHGIDYWSLSYNETDNVDIEQFHMVGTTYPEVAITSSTSSSSTSTTPGYTKILINVVFDRE